jgi:hypothetical protein
MAKMAYVSKGAFTPPLFQPVDLFLQFHNFPFIFIDIRLFISRGIPGLELIETNLFPKN